MTDKEQTKIFQKNLLRYLTENNKTQLEVANAIGVSHQTFSTWCRGIAIPRMGKMQLLADYFHINKSDLIEPAAPSDSVAPVQLRPDEGRLLKYYNKLNDFGQSKAMDYLSDLADNVKYLKGEDVSEGLSDVG